MLRGPFAVDKAASMYLCEEEACSCIQERTPLIMHNGVQDRHLSGIFGQRKIEEKENGRESFSKRPRLKLCSIERDADKLELL